MNQDPWASSFTITILYILALLSHELSAEGSVFSFFLHPGNFFLNTIFKKKKVFWSYMNYVHQTQHFLSCLLVTLYFEKQVLHSVDSLDLQPPTDFSQNVTGHLFIT